MLGSCWDHLELSHNETDRLVTCICCVGVREAVRLRGGLAYEGCALGYHCDASASMQQLCCRSGCAIMPRSFRMGSRRRHLLFCFLAPLLLSFAEASHEVSAQHMQQQSGGCRCTEAALPALCKQCRLLTYVP